MSSSRLRSRLAHGDFDAAQAAKVTENFVLIGTPLPSLEKRDHNEGKPVWEQEVRDEQGRRRFHGAFTGGWSAGYFNTVGSKEGWTPSNFVSSRSGRAGEASGSEPSSSKQARPEDFMDEEDLAELEESRKLGHRDGYAAVDSAAKNRHQDDVLGDLLGLGSARKQLEDSAETGLIAPRSSLGHRILTRMGWRPGSGIGPRVTGQRRRLMEQLLSLAPSTSLGTFKGADGATVPPPDTPMPALIGGSAKRDTHGLGWQPGSDSAGKPSKSDLAGAEDPRRRQGFDISVLEEADEDDLADIYSQSESIQATIDRRRDAAHANRLPAQASATTLRRDGLSSEEETRWRDGKLLPPGFIIDAISIIDSRQEQKQEDWFPPPDVAPQWKPDPVRVWSRAKSSAPPPLPLPSQRNQSRNGTSHLQAADRAQMLGEARMPGPPPSLADYLPTVSQPVKQPDPTSVAAPKLDVATAKAALQGSIPFGNDEAKQKRYIAYLESQADVSKREDLQPVPTGKTAEQAKAELEEFARSASIFKPLSSAMANRFASAITKEGAGDVHAPAPGLFQPEAKSREEREEEEKRKAEHEQARLKREREANMTDRQRAAQASMFGHLTREVKPWQPPRLLCKRFGVANPHAGKEREQPAEDFGDGPTMPRDNGDPFYGSGKEDAFQRSDARRELKRGEARWEKSKRELLGLVGERKWEEQGGQPLAFDGGAPESAGGDGAQQRSDVPPSLENVGLGEDDNQLRELDAAPKPSRDVFKSVFASDEEDSEEEPDQASTVASTSEAQGPRPATTRQPENDSSNTAAPGLARPTFVPRKKRQEADDAGAPQDAPAASKSTKKRKKEDKKKKKAGALTFDFDEDEEGESTASRPTQPTKKPRDAPRAIEAQAKSGRAETGPSQQTSLHDSRPAAERRARTKAADLF